jgi:serine/threonine-protein kinase
MDDDFAERRVGTTVRAKWRLEKLLGVGGMAAVYVGAHKIGRREAIKILHPAIARSKELRARFEQEAHAVNRFKHPGTVEIRDIDVTEDGAPFLVMELLEGESLSDRAQRPGGIELDEILRLADELLDVLVAAHAQGIIHRDIKPDNLFVQAGGRLKVLDFGIARVKAGISDLQTRAGAMLGTVPYMAPEQLMGGDIDARVDLFAVGATMFRLVARRRIHEAENEAQLLVKMGTEPAPPLASVAPGAPPGVCLVVDRALQFERDLRYPDAATMQRDIQALRAGAPPPGPVTAGSPVGGPPAGAVAVAALASSPAAPAGADAPTAAAAPNALQAPPAPMTAPARAPATWNAAALDATLLAAAAPRQAVTSPGVDPPSAPGFVPLRRAGPSTAALAAAGPASPTAPRDSDQKKWIALLLSLFVAALLLLVVIALIRSSGGGTETSSSRDPAALDPDEPAWRPSPGKRSPPKPPKKRHGHGHGRGHGRSEIEDD